MQIKFGTEKKKQYKNNNKLSIKLVPVKLQYQLK